MDDIKTESVDTRKGFQDSDTDVFKDKAYLKRKDRIADSEDEFERYERKQFYNKEEIDMKTILESIKNSESSIELLKENFKNYFEQYDGILSEEETIDTLIEGVVKSPADHTEFISKLDEDVKALFEANADELAEKSDKAESESKDDEKKSDDEDKEEKSKDDTEETPKEEDLKEEQSVEEKTPKSDEEKAKEAPMKDDQLAANKQDAEAAKDDDNLDTNKNKTEVTSNTSLKEEQSVEEKTPKSDEEKAKEAPHKEGIHKEALSKDAEAAKDDDNLDTNKNKTEKATSETALNGISSEGNPALKEDQELQEGKKWDAVKKAGDDNKHTIVDKAKKVGKAAVKAAVVNAVVGAGADAAADHLEDNAHDDALDKGAVSAGDNADADGAISDEKAAEHGGRENINSKNKKFEENKAKASDIGNDKIDDGDDKTGDSIRAKANSEVDKEADTDKDGKVSDEEKEAYAKKEEKEDKDANDEFKEQKKAESKLKNIQDNKDKYVKGVKKTATALSLGHSMLKNKKSKKSEESRAVAKIKDDKTKGKFNTKVVTIGTGKNTKETKEFDEDKYNKKLNSVQGASERYKKDQKNIKAMKKGGIDTTKDSIEAETNYNDSIKSAYETDVNVNSSYKHELLSNMYSLSENTLDILGSVLNESEDAMLSSLIDNKILTEALQESQLENEALQESQFNHNELASYSNVSELLEMDGSYFETTDYILVTPEDKTNKLLEEVSLMAAKQNNDTLYGKLLEAEQLVITLRDEIADNYLMEAADKSNEIKELVSKNATDIIGQKTDEQVAKEDGSHKRVHKQLDAAKQDKSAVADVNVQPAYIAEGSTVSKKSLNESSDIDKNNDGKISASEINSAVKKANKEAKSHLKKNGVLESALMEDAKALTSMGRIRHGKIEGIAGGMGPKLIRAAKGQGFDVKKDLVEFYKNSSTGKIHIVCNGQDVTVDSNLVK